MKCGSRFLISSGVISLLLIVLLWRKLQDLADQYYPLAYLEASLSEYVYGTENGYQGQSGFEGDKIIVMAKMEHEDASWVADELPE